MEPAKLDDFLLLFSAAAGVVLLGAAYAAAFALAHTRHAPRFMGLAYAAYAGLCVSAFALAYAANLYHDRFWMALVIVMLGGYFAAPHAILRLCRGTEAHTEQ